MFSTLAKLCKSSKPSLGNGLGLLLIVSFVVVEKALHLGINLKGHAEFIGYIAKAWAKGASSNGIFT